MLVDAILRSVSTIVQNANRRAERNTQSHRKRSLYEDFKWPFSILPFYITEQRFVKPGSLNNLSRKQSSSVGHQRLFDINRNNWWLLTKDIDNLTVILAIRGCLALLPSAMSKVKQTAHLIRLEKANNSPPSRSTFAFQLSLMIDTKWNETSSFITKSN